MRGCKASSPRRQDHERQTDAYQHERSDDDVVIGDRQRPDPGVDVVQRDIQQGYDAARTEGGRRQGYRRQQRAPDNRKRRRAGTLRGLKMASGSGVRFLKDFRHGSFAA